MRLYASFGPQLKQIKIRGTLEKLSSRSSLYSWNRSVTEVDAAANEAPKQLMALKYLERLRATREDGHFPRALQIKQLQLLYGAFLSDQELEGYPAEEAIKVKTTKKNAGDRRRSTVADTRRSLAETVTQKAVLQEAIATGDLTHGGTVRFQTRKTLKEGLDQTFCVPLYRAMAGESIAKCAACGTSQQVKRCSVCKQVYYCGVGCQKKDICRHRQEDGCGKRQEVSMPFVVPENPTSPKRCAPCKHGPYCQNCAKKLGNMTLAFCSGCNALIQKISTSPETKLVSGDVDNGVVKHEAAKVNLVRTITTNSTVSSARVPRCRIS
eukprot:symbB.v1.2.013485.t1/scaffold957.1/size148979/3